MPKRVKYDVNKIVEWLNSGDTFVDVDKRLEKSGGTTKRWLNKNGISICKQPPIFYWVALDKKQRVTS